jgi:hypothetical protein
MPSIMRDWGHVNNGEPMAKPALTSSASLHLRLGAFGALFTALAVAFNPLAAFVLAMVATYVLATV